MSRPVDANVEMGLTWESRLALWLPAPPILGALLIAGTLIGVQSGVHWLLDLPVHRLAIFMMLMIAYIMMVPRFFALRFAEDRKLFGLDVPVTGRRETEVFILGVPLDKIPPSRLAGAAGILVLFGLDGGIAYFEGASFPEFWITFHPGTITLLACLMIGWLIGRTFYFSSVRKHEFPLPPVADVDLLNLETLYAMGRSGLREALLWLVGMSIGSLFFLGSAVGWWGLVPVFMLGLVIGLAALLRPALKVKHLVHEAKRAELATLEPKLKQARDATLKDDGNSQGKLTDLLAYQKEVKATPEWPFDQSTLVRFGLYLLIPVVSMIAGALVERMVNAMLD